MGIPVPQPPESFIIGNLKEIDPDYGLGSLERLAKLYGPIYRLNILGQKLIVLSSQELVNEASSTSTWEKTLPTALKEIRALAGDGLFTAYNHEANWKLAHKILIPAFGPGNIRAMFPDMYDIASQLSLKWERFGEDNRIDVANDFTSFADHLRSTQAHVGHHRIVFVQLPACLHVEGHCCQDGPARSINIYRFNSFYKDTMHPFVEAMVDVLLESGQRTRRLPIQQTLMVRASRKYQQDIDYLHDLCDKIVAERKAHPTDSKDLLNLMLNGRDKETGEGLTVENIRYQMVTFLIAGHETTSGLLSFTFYYLLKNPHTLQRAQEEVDRVTQGQPLTLEHLPHLKYIDAALKEALRLNPTAPMFVVKPKQTSGTYTFDTGHEIDATENCGILLSTLHKDPKVWGDDADVFRPERMLDGGFEKLPPNSWKPFGNGMRACIGRPFAWQESLIVVAMILQRFNLELVDPKYDLRVKQTLTIKPVGFEMRARVRKGSRAVGSVGVSVHSPLSSPVQSHAEHAKEKGAANGDGVVGKASVEEKRAPSKITILYGSNSGSCESFAERVASDATSQGFTATSATLDSATESLPTDQPVVIICPSYEGQPADNAKRFVSWVTSLTAADALKGVKYAVFGAGHHDWAATYHRVPRLIDDTLAKLGAQRFLERGETDAAGDFFGDFESWEDKLWPALRSLLDIPESAVEEFPTQRRNSLEDLVVPSVGSTGPLLDVVILNEQRAAVLGQKDFRYGVVVENRKLTGDELKCGSLAKRHVEIKLPEGLTYRAGGLGIMAARL
ncbi:hypothetical protein HK097_001593 [Rhizophlyctis rosea]|uniref:Flavodoxin-like domain-containing protein n=1 Tax=Rhizophlyctis rosea TaxID=64517 RepID=A0AAD5S5G3_9FUNG|nr:hypothetical protein HK097_001593 [Rhizophlyctis rosea]